MRLPLLAAALTCALLVAGCGDATGPADPGPAERNITGAEEPLDEGGRDPSVPPALELSSAETTVVAHQGSFCWGNGCSDMVMPTAAELPAIGPAGKLDALFPDPASWSVWISEGVGARGCGSYPVLVEADGDGHLVFTPSGPAGDRVASYFYRSNPGDSSGWWRWKVPSRDGTPLAWIRLNQNSPFAGGMADLTLVLDDAAVDGDVAAEVTVEAADGGVATFALSEVDQHCPGDGFVELSTPDSMPDSTIDRLGATPYRYEVDLQLDGSSRAGTATWLGEGTEYGGDAVVTFDPGLPALP
jgi:hypothetical protein